MDDEPAIDTLDATYRARCDHGSADLALQDIAAETRLLTDEPAEATR